MVDTNVLIAASAADPTHPSDIDATPAEPEWRQKVWEWLDEFDRSASRLVLDHMDRIRGEYRGSRYLNEQSFGIQVTLHKWDLCQCDFVQVEYDDHGDGILPDSLVNVVHDRADRKMVAAALASHEEFGEGCVAFAGDTDWHDWEKALAAHHVLLEPVIEEWSRAKHAAKKKR